jgi:anaerobic sulfite reductase subunit A
MEELTQNRSQTYRFLSQIYRVEVSEDFLKSMQSNEFLEQLEIMGKQFRDVNFELSKGFELLGAFLHASKTRPSAEVLEDLAVDFARLFLLKGGVHPYESVYLGKEKLLMEDPWLEVKKEYSSAGLVLRDVGEPEDHIAFELEFMHKLCQKISEALARGERAEELLRMQSRFLNDHLLKWVPDLCQAISEQAATDFYLAVALITKGFLEFDSRIVKQFIEE